jgi:pilus assembly protein TadC
MIAVAVLAAAWAAWLTVSAPATLIRRLGEDTRGAVAVGVGRHAPDKSWVESGPARGALCAGSGAALGVAIGGLPTAVAGAVLGGLVSWLIGRLEPPSARRRRESIERDLPLAVELLAACALAGRPVEASVDVVSSAVGGPLSDLLSEHTARVRLGADPVTEWRAMASHPQVAPLARSVLRSLESGAPVVDTFERLAADSRRARAVALQQRARSVGVRAAGPLGICFLPAFMLVGVVPTVVGGFTHLVL